MAGPGGGERSEVRSRGLEAAALTSFRTEEADTALCPAYRAVVSL